MNGYEVVVSPYLCKMQFARWARWPKSRKKRIRRKWQKRFGPVLHCVADSAYTVGNTLTACPHLIAKLEKVIAKLELAKL